MVSELACGKLLIYLIEKSDLFQTNFLLATRDLSKLDCS